MCAVARKQNTPLAEAFHATTLEGIDRDPFQLELDVFAQHRLEARDDILGALFTFLVDVPAQLQVDTPDVVRLFVQKRRLPAIERRVEPEPAFRREIGIHDHIRDQEVVFEHTPFEIDAQHPARGRGGSVTGDQPFSLKRE